MLRRGVVRVPRCNHSTQRFNINTELKPRYSHERLSQVLEKSKEFPLCSSGRYLSKHNVKEYDNQIRTLAPIMLQVCHESPLTLQVENTPTGFDIIHTPHSGVVIDSKVQEASSAIPRSSEIRSLHLLDNIAPYRKEQRRRIADRVWKKIHSQFSRDQKWPLITGDWIYLTKQPCPLPELAEELKEWKECQRYYNYGPIFNVVNDLIRYGDDGYVVLNHYIEYYNNSYSLWKFDQTLVQQGMDMAEAEYQIASQLKSGRSVNEIAKEFPRGSLVGLPYDPEQVPYFNRLYSYVNRSKQRLR
jgi:hypothetical protein